MEGKSSEEVEMMKLMGFTTFDTTKNKKVKKKKSCNNNERRM
jgi:hypothetical protein